MKGKIGTDHKILDNNYMSAIYFTVQLLWQGTVELLESFSGLK